MAGSPAGGRRPQLRPLALAPGPLLHADPGGTGWVRPCPQSLGRLQLTPLQGHQGLGSQASDRGLDESQGAVGVGHRYLAARVGWGSLCPYSSQVLSPPAPPQVLPHPRPWLLGWVGTRPSSGPILLGYLGHAEEGGPHGLVAVVHERGDISDGEAPGGDGVQHFYLDGC